MSFVADSTFQTLQNLYKSYLDSRFARENSYSIRQKRDSLAREVSKLEEEIRNEEKKLDVLNEEKRTLTGDNVGKTQESIETQLAQEEEDLRKKLEADLKENRDKLAQFLSELYGDNADEYLSLTDDQKQALEFAKRRISITEAWDIQLNKLNDAIAQEELDCQNDENGLFAQKTDILRAYEPELKKYQNQINRIKDKYRPDLEKISEHHQHIINEKEQYIADCENRQRSIAATVDSQIKILKRQQKKAKKEFDSQIAKATAENRATTRLKTSQINENNRYEHEISNTQNKGKLEIEKLANEISAITIRYNSQISSDKQEYDRLVNVMNRELREPEEAYDNLKRKQESQEDRLDDQISQREEKKDRAIGRLKEEIDRGNAEYTSKIQQLESEMREYAMSGETCLNEKTQEVYQEFIGLESRVEAWKKAEQTLAHSIGEKDTQGICSKQKEKLQSMDYEMLMSEVEQAEKLPLKVNPLQANYKNGIGITAILCTLGIFVCLFGMKLSSAVSVALPAIVLAGAAVGLRIYVSKRLTDYCTAEMLATGYRGFRAVSQRSSELTIQAEFESLKQIGDELFLKHQGPEQARKKADMVEKDLQADYERNLGALRAKATAEKNKLANMLALREQNLEEKEQEIRAVSAKHTEWMRKKESTNKTLEDYEKKLASCLKATEIYRDNCREMDKLLPDLKPRISEFEGPLKDQIYLIQEKDAMDENGDKPVYVIEHEKKPIIVLYDLSKKEDSTSRNVQIGMINEIIRDFSRAFSWVNLSYILEQAIVQPFDASSFKEAEFVKKCHIKSVGTDIDDIKSFLSQCENDRNRIAESGKTLDDLNRKNYENGSEPQPYHITYLAFKPEQTTGKLNEKVAGLLPHCDRYGFLPIFICEMNAWKQGTENGKEGNLYLEIKNYEYSCMLSYDGEIYKEL